MARGILGTLAFLAVPALEGTFGDYLVYRRGLHFDVQLVPFHVQVTTLSIALTLNVVSQ